MADMKQLKENRPEKKNGRKQEPTILTEQTGEFTGVDGPQGEFHDAKQVGNAEAQAAQLVDTRLPATQRRIFASLIGKTQGNAHLQRMILVSRAYHPGVGGMVQRITLTEAERAENLTSPRFAGDPQLEAAFDNDPPLRVGAHGDGVAKVQQAIIDDGYQMPVTSRASGTPDGDFGPETRRTVRWFQQKYDLPINGIVDRVMLRKLDQLFGGHQLPVAATPEISDTQQAAGEEIVRGINRANGPKTPNSGIWYPENYRRMYVRNPSIYRWDPDYMNGYANPTYFERLDTWDWRLKPGVSASEGIRAWLRGLTIAECLTTMVAVHYNAVRAALGDRKFDETFGGPSNPVSEDQRLHIANGTTPLDRFMQNTEPANTETSGTVNNRPAQIGEWYYFSNHPKYPLKHPRESWQGENAIYAGRNRARQQIWSGLGVSNATENTMYTKMVNFYNKPRTEHDYAFVVNYCTKPGMAITEAEMNALGNNYRAIYRRYKNRILDRYREDRGEFPDQITKQQLLTAPPYSLTDPVSGDTEERTGGFQARSGWQLNMAEVTRVRNE
jgi:peptidoglycan hydrolase-like protein with peptidoglycan-binding domain